MKSFKYFFLFLLLFTIGFSVTSCNDFLDKEPLDEVTPETFLWSDADLSAYIIKQYNFNTHSGAGVGIWAIDNHTDNQAASNYNGLWIPGEWRVPDRYQQDSEDPWYFGEIYNLNYFLETVLPRSENGTLTGNVSMIHHNIGEAFFLRAWNYFKKLQAFGDFPIITETLPDKQDVLVEASKRQPRHKVARFILQDLDKAIELLSENPSGGTNRITKHSANLLKSRVALYEASWLTYHAGTAMVPNGPGYKGGAVEYDAQEEIKFFLEECKKAASAVADKIPLADNTHVWADGKAKMDNPYFAQFSADDLSAYPEILFWRDYDVDLGIRHSASYYISQGGNSGFTRQYVETFLMKNGLPIYATGSGYAGDLTIEDVRKNRDERLLLFMMTPGEQLTTGQVSFEHLAPELPNILAQEEVRNVTGYQLRKGSSNNWSRDWNENAEGCPIFRAAEAYLNYIEASCMENNGNSIDATASAYWSQLRSRAGLPGDYAVTVNATDLSKESDWAVYSKNQKVSSLLYNIRRERRCELIEEGMRMFDLKRWRALDQLDGTWQPEGINFWESGLYKEYVDDEGHSQLIADGSAIANVSSSSRSTYLRPYEIVNRASNQMWNKGYKWCEAHYLNPIAITHFRTTASNPTDINTSVIYQNPGWPMVASEGPICN